MDNCEQPMMDFHDKRPTILRNSTCIYCGQADSRLTTEHVIGRRFVPRGTLANAWNLIANACEACNSAKSDLEDDISAVTMQPDVTGNHVIDDPLLATEGKRKGRRSVSRHTSRRVGESTTQLGLQGEEYPGLSWSASMIVPPQIQPARIERLARLQVHAFIYVLTYDDTVKAGRCQPEVFGVANSAPAMDWGNATQRDFMRTTLDWEPLLAVDTARGFYKAGLWKAPSSNCWGWALEWNMQMRVVGFVGDQSSVTRGLKGLAQRPGQIYPQKDGSTVILRKEVPLDPGEDMLFTFNEAT